MKAPVGEVRPSQLLWTYGPGALIDLPNLSVVTMGLDQWTVADCRTIDEKRLLAAVRKMLGPQVDHLRMPPVIEDQDADPYSPAGMTGVPVKPFPRWLRCVKCGLLAEFDSGLFKLKEDRYRPENNHFEHENCPKGRKADAVPARFLLACRNGHLDDFPWHWFVHSGPTTCKGNLFFYEHGASLQTENLWVRCECGAARSLVHAFGKEAQDNLPACRGRHPHLDSYGECKQPPRSVILGATNSWFAVSLSVLAIPPLRNPLAQLVQAGWDYFEDMESVVEVKAVVKTLVKSGHLSGIEKYAPEEIFDAIQAKRDGKLEETDVTEADIKSPEWEVLIDPTPPTDWPFFLSRKEVPPPSYRHVFTDVLLLERLREVNALIGFTRVEAPEETADPDERPPMADLARSKPKWVPANEVHGEGIFIRFDEKTIQTWEAEVSVQKRDRLLQEGHRYWRAARKLDPSLGYPGIRYALLHTLAHLLIRELALECGYNAASIRERIYASADKENPMAGILLYTAAADSDGTLGGLVDLGKPENLGRLLDQALRRAKVCSSDPLCSEHDPTKDNSLHSAACHACGFVAETSCERGNRYLDRALLVKTFDCVDAAFFEDGVK